MRGNGEGNRRFARVGLSWDHEARVGRRTAQRWAGGVVERRIGLARIHILDIFVKNDNR